MPTNSPGYWNKKRSNGETNYKHYQWKKSDISYRSKLNQANRDKGTYGNGDGKDLQHVDDNKKNFSPGNLRTGSMRANRKAGAAKANGKKHTSFAGNE